LLSDILQREQRVDASAKRSSFVVDTEYNALYLGFPCIGLRDVARYVVR
jgi:hypothetical protein